MAAFPRATALAVALMLLAGPAARAARGPVMTPSDPTYEVRLRGGSHGKTWTGTEEIVFRNSGSTTLGRIWIRTWGNGIDGCSPRRVRITAVRYGTLGEPRHDCTAYPVELDQPVEPGGTGSVALSLHIEVPDRNDRFGYHDGTALLGNALPILAVRDPSGWHLDPYVDFGESFFSLSGRFRVTLNVPAALDTPATGALVKSRVADDRVVRTYGAHDVRDFAWAAGRLESSARRARGVTVRVWYRPGLTNPEVQLARAVRSMRTFSDAFGRYPYREVDVLITDFVRFSGMEYPQIVFTNPQRYVISHELSHQWWYSVVGNDQYDAPWLDEGFATWSQFLPWEPWAGCRGVDWPDDSTRLTNDMGYWSRHQSWYGIVYAGGGCMLSNLAGRFGLVRFDELLAGYAAEHRSGVVSTRDFQSAVEEAAALHLPGFDPEAFWRRWRVG